MENYILMKENQTAVDLSRKLGYSGCRFLNKELVYLNEKNKKTLLKEIAQAKRKKLLIIYEPSSEELLRFALEKTPVDMVIGIENIHSKEHTHYVRSGLNQVLCKIAAQHHKIIGFDFADILNSTDRGKLMARMKFNLKFCRKYHLQTKFFDSSGHASEQDLKTFFRVLEKEKIK